jgi:hypothetical protein
MDIAMIIITAVSVFVSVVALCISYHASQKGNSLASVANNLTNTANEMQKGQIELQIREMISAARSRYEDKVEQNLDTDIHKALVKSAYENFLNAYDEACMKYLDGKVDKDRFKKAYEVEIRQLIENPANDEYYNKIQSKFNSTKEVYSKWNNPER